MCLGPFSGSTAFHVRLRSELKRSHPQLPRCMDIQLGILEVDFFLFLYFLLWILATTFLHASNLPKIELGAKRDCDCYIDPATTYFQIETCRRVSTGACAHSRTTGCSSTGGGSNSSPPISHST